MELFGYYLQYLTAVCEGGLKVEGFSAEGGDEAEKAMDLQRKIAAVGLPEFVRRCAVVTGDEIPQEVYDSFDPQALAAALQAQLSARQSEAAPDPPAGASTARPSSPQSVPVSGEHCSPLQPEPAADDEAPKQNAYEAFLDCLSLEDALLEYLIDVLKRDDGLAFFRLSQVTVRRELKLHDFLYWLGTKELYAEVPERACATIMDACMDRLAAEGQLELIAALISGDRTTFERFRVDAPELRQLPDATWEWYEEYYLSRYYPCRVILKLRGVKFPAFDYEKIQLHNGEN